MNTERERDRASEKDRWKPVPWKCFARAPRSFRSLELRSPNKTSALQMRCFLKRERTETVTKNNLLFVRPCMCMHIAQSYVIIIIFRSISKMCTQLKMHLISSMHTAVRCTAKHTTKERQHPRWQLSWQILISSYLSFRIHDFGIVSRIFWNKVLINTWILLVKRRFWLK